MDSPKKLSQPGGSDPHDEHFVVKIDTHEKGKKDDNHRGVSDSKRKDDNDDIADNKASSSDNDSDEDEYQLPNQRHNDQSEGDSDQVVNKFTSSQKRASFLTSKTHRSRLTDPPEPQFSNDHGSTRLIENDEEDESVFGDDNPGDLDDTKLDTITIIQWISLVLILTSLFSTIRFPRWKQRSFMGLFMWQWELLILVLICGRLVSGWCVRVAVFFIERNFLLRKRLLYFVYGVRTPVQNCIWLCWVLIAWNSVFNDAVAARGIPLLDVINKFMVCMLVTTSLWLIKTLVVKVLASSFHVSKFFDRIQDALFNQYVIETLSGPPLLEIRKTKFGEKIGAVYSFKRKKGRRKSKSKKHGDQQSVTIDQMNRWNHENVSAWNMKRLMKIIRHGSLTTIDERLQVIYSDEPGTEIRSELEAKRAARSIFANVTKRKSKYIYLDDLMRFLREDEAVKTMSLIVASPEDERIEKTTLKNWVVGVFRERKSLALTLNDTKTAVNKLHKMVNVLTVVVNVIICLVILNIMTTQVIVLISSQFVVVAFIFGNTCKTIFESIIFLFVIHPFDVGDRCEIGGVQMIVEEMNILNTIFLRSDNQKIYFPNSTLATRDIGNFYRSPDMMDTINFLIHVGTPADKISLIKQRIVTYVESNKDHWYPNPIVITMDMYDPNTQKLALWLKHKINNQHVIERLTRRGKVIEEMNRIFKELDLEYRTYPLDINVRSMPLNVSPTRTPSTWG